MRAEPRAVGHRNGRAPQGTLERPLEVAVAGEPRPAPLGVTHPQPLDRRNDLAVGNPLGHQRAGVWSRSARAPAAITVSGSSCRPVGPTSMSVPSCGQTPQSKHGVQRQSSTSTSSRRVLPVLPEPVLVQADCRGGPTAAPRRTHVRGWCTSRRRPADRRKLWSAAAIQRSNEKCSLQPSNRAPARHTASMHGTDPAVAARQQSLDDARLPVVVAETDRLAVLAVARGSRRAAWPAARRWPSWTAAPPTGTACAAWGRSRRSRPCTGCRVDPTPRVRSAITSRANRAICSTSSSVSVGQAAHEVELHLAPARCRRRWRRCGSGRPRSPSC